MISSRRAPRGRRASAVCLVCLAAGLAASLPASAVRAPSRVARERSLPAISPTAAYYVDDDAPGDPGPGDPGLSDPVEDGSPAHPFDRIQEALDVALPADLIRVLPGIYVEDLDVPVGGAAIAGSGPRATFVRAATGAGLGGVMRSDAALPPSLSLSELTLEGPVFLYVDSDSYLGVPAAVSLADVDLVSGSLGAAAFGTLRLTLRRVRATGTDIVLVAGTASDLDAEMSDVTAPDSSIFVDGGGTEGYARLSLADSTVGGVDVSSYSYAFGASLRARDVHFTGSGITGQSGGACSWEVGVERCMFDRGGIGARGPAGDAGICGGTYATIRVDGSTFRHGGVDFSASFSAQSFYFPGGDRFGLEVTSSRFAGSGIAARLIRPETVAAGDDLNAATIRIVNDLFDSAPVGLDVLYAYPAAGLLDPAGSIRGSLEVVNNTFSRSGTGVAITTQDHPPGTDTLTTLLANNIVAWGGTGLSILGTGDQTFSILHNDAFGNARADYAGDLADPTGTGGNISEDPRLQDHGRALLALRAGSPCIDAGHAGPEVPPADVAGTPRPQDGDGDGRALPDIGAYEFVFDADGDGYAAGADCDDADPAVNPTSVELPGNRTDEDCDGAAACDPAGAWHDHGRFVRCVSRACETLLDAGALTRQECARMVAQAARGKIGRKGAARTRPPR